MTSQKRCSIKLEPELGDSSERDEAKPSRHEHSSGRCLYPPHRGRRGAGRRAKKTTLRLVSPRIVKKEIHEVCGIWVTLLHAEPEFKMNGAMNAQCHRMRQDARQVGGSVQIRSRRDEWHLLGWLCSFSHRSMGQQACWTLNAWGASAPQSPGSGARRLSERRAWHPCQNDDVIRLAR